RQSEVISPWARTRTRQTKPKRMLSVLRSKRMRRAGRAGNDRRIPTKQTGPAGLRSIDPSLLPDTVTLAATTLAAETAPPHPGTCIAGNEPTGQGWIRKVRPPRPHQRLQVQFAGVAALALVFMPSRLPHAHRVVMRQRVWQPRKWAQPATDCARSGAVR